MSTWSFLSVIHPLRIPIPMYRTRRKFGFNKKTCTKLLMVYVYFQPNSCNTRAECEWAQGTFLRQWRKVPPAYAQRVYFTATFVRSLFPVCNSREVSRIMTVSYKITLELYTDLVFLVVIWLVFLGIYQTDTDTGHHCPKM